MPTREKRKLQVGLSVREPRRVQRRKDAQSIFVIELLQDRIRKLEPIHLPKPVIASRWIKILIRCLQKTEIGPVFRNHVSVFSEQNPILILFEETAGESRLTAEFAA